MKLKTLPILLILIVLALPACSPTRTISPVVSPTTASSQVTQQGQVPSLSPSSTLIVMAADSLAAPFTELGKVFETAHPGISVQFTYPEAPAGQAANPPSPADVVASDLSNDMDALVQAGQVAKAAPKIFAENKLVVIFPAANPAGINQLQDLAKPGLKLALANGPAPLGMYTITFLGLASADPAFKTSYQNDVMQNAGPVAAENSQAVLTQVAAGQVDAGICYLSDLTSDLAAKVSKLEIPDALNVVAIYSIAAYTSTSNPVLAQAFIDLVLSGAGQQVLLKYGLIPTNP